MDDAHSRSFLEGVVRTFAARRHVVLTTLHMDSRLAAYVLCLIDGDSYRMWHHRFSPEFAHYGTGRLVVDASLAEALADDGAAEYDWMRGEEQYKSSFANAVVPAEKLRASSALAVRLVADARDSAKASLVERLEHQGPVKKALFPMRTIAARGLRNPLQRSPGRPTERSDR
jgi:CelD/BcsL family acetyltransferase involved in cellulose biosynthesis